VSEIASAYVSLLPSAKGFGSKLNTSIGPDIDKAGRLSGGRFGRLFFSSSMRPLRAFGAAAVGLFAIDKVKDFFESSMDEARESQKVGALTEQVIRSTGHAANVSAKQIGNLATTISNKVGVDDEAIQSGENMLLTFKNIRNEAGAGNKIFNQASKTMVDMAASMAAASGGQVDFKSAAIQLGKALNDPVKGITALSRVGVTFDAQQQKQIKSLVASGKTMDAQKIILKELTSEFGGSAASQATAGEKMSVAWGNLKEQIGTAVIPVLDAVEGVITKKVIPSLSNGVGHISTFGSNIVGAFDVLRSGGPIDKRLDGFADELDYAFGNTGKLADPLGRAFGSVEGFVAKVSPGVHDLAGATSDFFQSGAGHGALLGAFKLIKQRAKDTLDLVGQIGDAFSNVDLGNIDSKQLGQALGQSVLSGLDYLTSSVGQITDAVGAMLGSVDWVGLGISLGPKVLGLAVGLVTGLVRGLTDPTLWHGIWENLPEILVAVLTIAFAPSKLAGPLERILTRIPFAGKFLAAIVRGLQSAGDRVAAAVGSFVGDIGREFAAGFGKVRIPGSGIVRAVMGALRGIPGAVGSFFDTLGTRIGVWALDAVGKAGPAVRRGFDKVVNIVGRVPGRVIAALGDVGSLLHDSGRALIRGLAQGITDAGKAAYDAAKGVLSKVSHLFPHSPAKEGPFSGKGYTLHSGKKLIEDLGRGMKGGAPAALKSLDSVLGKMQDAIGKHTSKATKTAIRGFQKQANQFSRVYDSLTNKLTDLQDTFNSIRSGVASNLSGDLFSGFTNAGSFLSNLFKTKGSLTALTNAFNKLVGEGISGAFLSQLFQSGGAPLILSLAAGSQQQASLAASTFSDINSLAATLGGNVASVTPSGDSLLGTKVDQTNKELTHLNNKIDRLAGQVGTAVGDVVNGAHVKGKKKNPKRKGK
jgi:uncharacterized protein YukE